MYVYATLEEIACINYIEVCEEFLGFCSVPIVHAEAITSAIVGLANGTGLNLAKLVGKGFDGAATMSGHVSGFNNSTQMPNISLTAVIMP